MEKQVILIPSDTENPTAAVVSALAKAKEAPTKIVFEAAEYRFSGAGAYIGRFYPTSNASGEKRVVFPILGVRDLEIDGGGARFVFCDRLFPFIIQNSERIKIGNFTLDFSFPRHFEGLVTYSDASTLSLAVDRSVYGYRVDSGDIVFSCGESERSSAEHFLFHEDLDRRSAGVAYLATSSFGEPPYALPAPLLRVAAEETDEGLTLHYSDETPALCFEVGDRIMIGNDENRENDAFFAEFSIGIEIHDVAMHRVAGMAFIMQASEDIALSHISLVPDYTRGDSLSATADAVHMVNCRGIVSVTESQFEHVLDDAVNIHGSYAVVRDVLDDGTLRVSYAHPPQKGLVAFRSGDLIGISSPGETREYMSAVVESVGYPSDRAYLDLKVKGVGIKVGSLIENKSARPHFIFSQNRVHAAPQIRISSKTALLEGNELSLSNSAIYISDLMRYWYESGAVDEVVLRGNKIKSRETPVYVGSEREPAGVRRHRRLVLEGNHFSVPIDEALSLRALDELVLKGNSFAKKDEDDKI